MNMKEDRGVAVVGHNDVFSTSQEKDPALCADITINNKYNLAWLRYVIEDVKMSKDGTENFIDSDSTIMQLHKMRKIWKICVRLKLVKEINV